MDIEQLSKSQVILLTLLVTFVTSIATGIVTVSLMEKAPPTIAQTVNRVVEHTVEKIVPSSQTASVVTQEKTIVVKESDLIAQAVEKVSPSVVRLYATDTAGGTFFGLGIVLSADGVVVTDTAALGDAGDAIVVLPDGTKVRAFVNSRNPQNGLAFLQGATTTPSGDATKTVVWKPVTVSASHSVLGETIVSLSGKGLPRIADGIIVALHPASEKVSDILETNISESSIMRGSPLIDTDGGLIGISTEIARATSGSGFLSSSSLLPSSKNTQ